MRRIEYLRTRLDDAGVPNMTGPNALRNLAEYEEGHIPGSIHIPCAQLRERLGELPRDAPIATICKAGKRSGLAASILQREGFEDVIHVSRGNAAKWVEAAQ